MRFHFDTERRKLEEVQMKEGTWFVHRWRMDCPACKARVGEEEAAYCPNCGKWLGVVRKHAWTFLIASFWGVTMGGSCLIASQFVGDQTAVPLLWATAIFFFLGALPVLAIKPFGLRLLWWEGKKRRAQEWNAEIAQRKQETATKQKRTAGVCNCGEGDESLVHFVWCEKTREDTKKRRFPLYAGSGFTQTKLGTIELLTENPIRAQINEGWGSLHYFENAKGVLENFFLELIPAQPLPTVENDSAPMKLALSDIVYRWGRFRDGCTLGPQGPKICSNCYEDEMAVCEMINKARLLLEGKKVGDLHSPRSGRIHEIGLSARKEKRCRLHFGSKECGIELSAQLGRLRKIDCDGTLENCREWDNEERFAP